MYKFAWIILPLVIVLCACENKDKEKKETVKVKKEVVKDTVDIIDSTEITLREAELMKEDSLMKIEEEKRMKAKQECATKVVFLEKFYEDYFSNPEKAVSQYCSTKLFNELKSQASQYEGNAMPIWIFASGSGAANVSYRVNIPENEFSNNFVVDISEKGKSYKVYLTVVGSNGYYSIDAVKNSLGY